MKYAATIRTAPSRPPTTAATTSAHRFDVPITCVVM
jgi:hypothetical protein